MFHSISAWAVAQADAASLDSTILVNSYPLTGPIFDRTILVLAAAAVLAAAIGTGWLLDQRAHRKQTERDHIEWSRLQRSIRDARRDFASNR
jgi:hypothetical protein